MTKNKKGFTLIELLVVVIIIGLLAAIALPQYRKAVVRSKFHALMPIAKSLANSNEAYYLEHNNYTEDPSELLVQGKSEPYPDGTSILLYNDPATMSYVRAANDDIPNIRYVVTQKHSANMPDTSWCEANDDNGEELCKSFMGGNSEDAEGGSGTEAGWTAYLLSGDDDGSLAGGGNNGGNNNAVCEGEAPAPINAASGATGTATCVNGQWKYVWTGGSEINDCDDSVGDGVYSEESGFCAGHTYVGGGCNVGGDYGCAGSTFSGEGSSCTAQGDGGGSYSCAGSTFSGEGSYCMGWQDTACRDSIFSGDQSYCFGQGDGVCAGSEIQAGAYCNAFYEGACDGTTYTTHPDKDQTLTGCCDGEYCPSGSPKCKRDEWGELVWNDETHAYEIDGTW